MNTWQRRVRLALLVFVAVFAVALFFALRREPPQTKAPPVKRADPTAALESTRGVSIQFKGEKQQLKVESEETLVYANGARRLKGIKVSVAERAGRSFILTGDAGDVGVDESSVKVTGHVKLVASDGLTVMTDEAFYTQADGMVRAAGPVQFSRGRMHGTAVGLTYDKNADQLELLDQVEAEVAPDAAGEGSARLTAGTATLARQEKIWHLGRGVRVLRAGRALEAATAVAHLSEDESRVQRIELTGGSRIIGGGDTQGSLEAMSARDMDLTYAPDADRLQQALLVGGAAVQIAGAEGARGRRIAGEWMNIGLAPDGATVTSMTARDRVRLDLPPDADTPGRTVQSAVLEATGTPAAGITSAIFTDNVEFREARPAQAAPRVAYAGAMTLALAPNFGVVQEARFSKGVRFEEGDLRASAREAQYLVTKGVLNLSGNDERTARPPQAVDPKVTITAASIEIGLDTHKIAAKGSVNSVLRTSSAPAGKEKPAAAGQPTAAVATSAPAPAGAGDHRPALLQGDQPAYVTSESLVYDSASNLAVYTGNARLWQGDTTIQGDRLTLDDSKGDLTVVGAVRANLVMYQINDETKARDRVPTKGTSETMVYTDETRKIVFTRGPAKSATLVGAEGDLTADRIDVYLNAGGDELDHLEAEGGVISKLPQQRTAAGKRLVYTAADERYVMNGAPVQVFEQLTDGCRITSGTTLTLFKSTDRIVADGNQERRTETKNGGKCAVPGLD